jgi:hypothetical protein
LLDIEKEPQKYLAATTGIVAEDKKGKNRPESEKKAHKTQRDVRIVFDTVALQQSNKFLVVGSLQFHLIFQLSGFPKSTSLTSSFFQFRRRAASFVISPVPPNTAFGAFNNIAKTEFLHGHVLTRRTRPNLACNRQQQEKK